MNKLDKALLDFWANNDGKKPTVIYIGWNVLRNILVSDRGWQLDRQHQLYNGIPCFVVRNDDHLAIY